LRNRPLFWRAFLEALELLASWELWRLSE